MITVRRAGERGHDRERGRRVWRTFDPEVRAQVLGESFEVLEALDEDRLSPGARAPRRSDRDIEIVTYVHEGALAHEDSTGRSGVIHAGEVQRRTAGTGIHHSESNASRANGVHLFQIRLRPFEVGLEPSTEQQRFSAAERRGRLCLVTSPDARSGSMRVHQDALILSAMLDPGQHVVHELSLGRSAWVHLLHGEAALDDTVLATGDGAGVTFERAVSLTAREKTEILLVDLGEPPARSLANRAVA